MVRRLIDEIRLFPRDPGVRLHLGEVDAAQAQCGNEVSGVNVLELELRKMDSRKAAAMSVCRSMICPPINAVFIYSSFVGGQGQYKMWLLVTVTAT